MASADVHLIETSDDESMLCGIARARGRRYLNLRRAAAWLTAHRSRPLGGPLCSECERRAIELGYLPH